MKWICETCIWLKIVWGTERITPYYQTQRRQYAFCSHPKIERGMVKAKRNCQYYQNVKFTKEGGIQYKGGEKVKIGDIPSEADRVPLADLPQTNELIALEEKVAEATKEKVGGLVITFQQRDKKTFPQKYSKISGRALAEAMIKLGIDDTEELQNSWYLYKLVAMRTGYPRYIPQKKLAK